MHLPILLTALALLAATALPGPAAQAAQAWRYESDGVGGYEVYFGEAGEDEKIPFFAACAQPGRPIGIWYLIERSRLSQQAVDAQGRRRKVESLGVVLVVDGRRFAYPDARAEPEETYDANIVVLTLDAGDPLFAALARGTRLSLEVDGSESDALPLTGSFGPFTRLLGYCAAPDPQSR
jgi:hypothetical protein